MSLRTRSAVHEKTTKLKRALSHWGPWMLVAYLGLVSITVAGFVLNGKTVKRDATRTAAIDRCLATRPELVRISRHLRGVNDLAHVLVKNSRLAYEATPDSDPQKRVRLANLHRIEQAEKDIASVKRLPVPTVAECHDMGFS